MERRLVADNKVDSRRELETTKMGRKYLSSIDPLRSGNWHGDIMAAGLFGFRDAIRGEK